MTFLTELERLEKEATPEKWRLINSFNGDHGAIQCGNDGGFSLHLLMPHRSGNMALIVHLRNHSQAIADLVRAAQRALEHADFQREANKEEDALNRAGILGGMVASISDELRPALAALDKEAT